MRSGKHMNNVIKKIIQSDDEQEIECILLEVMQSLYQKGPTSVTDMEILSYLKMYRPQILEKYSDSIINYLGLFYKNPNKKTLKDVVFDEYKKYIQKHYSYNYTPVQANIVKGVNSNNCFSFSAPTSTGKSFVFLNLIQENTSDVVIVVPSRALINEYYLNLSRNIKDKTVNILTFIDKINTERARRSIFIVTPERCRDLFKQKDEFNIDLLLFDEAQLSDENSKRGLYFDSIVRRCLKSFPYAKFVFAHPFVNNPESQIKKNHFSEEFSASRKYEQKSVGQMFMCIDSEWNFFHFGVDKDVMGKKKVRCNSDPIEQIIQNKGSVLFYVSKASILQGVFYNRYQKYIDMCSPIENEEVDTFVELLALYTGGKINVGENYYSQMLHLLKRGIVIHHGSLPLQIRILIEEFTKKGFCRICFATSTLEQGINMPFDLIYIGRLEASKPLSVKNLIGRAGRSTTKAEFNYGTVVLSSASGMSKFREIIKEEILLDNISILEKNEAQDSDIEDFKKSILDGTYSDEYNLTQKELQLLEKQDSKAIIEQILALQNSNEISFSEINKDLFIDLYEKYLGRDLEDAEQDVLNTALKIMFWKMEGKTFKQICWFRYAYASRTGDEENRANLSPQYITGYQDLPNKQLARYPLFPRNELAKDVNYDLIMCDTYDYLDKLIGFKLSDIYYAAFSKYYETTNDPKALSFARYLKYGTNNEKYIWMLRYGIPFDDLTFLDEYVKKINSEGVEFYNSISNVPTERKECILRFL